MLCMHRELGLGACTTLRVREVGQEGGVPWKYTAEEAHTLKEYGSWDQVEEQEIDVREDSVAANTMVGWDDKVSREHFHQDFEVRCVLEGEVVWDVRSKADTQLSDPGDRWIRAHVHAGQCAYIPKVIPL
ncbi:hypothetical protein CYMTET_12887 [Cymbomonas tetramitiformis]|uniref:Uncharacterized protein n=1 Tax=Cymbomonas tetramitiformis TaxID=36881 RepID=A0AAE0GJF1_9CHLO|nr:hypothetical protein CYMTET_12887 [Cymbomonas tetramitiformis]